MPPSTVRSSRRPGIGRTLDLLGSTMHVVDTGGAGPILVFLHGNPTSSYLWRHVTDRLAGQFRCVAVDLIGMGGSGKPDLDYTWDDHRRFLTAALDQVFSPPGGPLWVVGHDWGVGLGLEYARTHPDRIAGVAMMEGHLRPLASWDDFDEHGRELFRQLRDPATGKRMVEDDNLFLTTVLPAGVHRTLTAEELQPYLEPFPTPESRRPIWRWVTQMPVAGTPADVRAVLADNFAWLTRSTLPRLLMWATPGAVISPEAARELQDAAPGLELGYVGEGLHFLPEDQPQNIANAISCWVMRSGRT